MAGYTQAQIDAMTGAEWAALGGPVAIDAPYSTGLNVPGYGPVPGSNIVGTGFTSNDPRPDANGLPSLPALPNLSDAINNALQTGLGSSFGLGGGAVGASASSPSVGSALSFLTDIPRVATTLVGIIVLIVGIVALTRGPAIQVIGNVAHRQLTS